MVFSWVYLYRIALFYRGVLFVNIMHGKLILLEKDASEDYNKINSYFDTINKNSSCTIFIVRYLSSEMII